VKEKRDGGPKNRVIISVIFYHVIELKWKYFMDLCKKFMGDVKRNWRSCQAKLR